MSSARSWIDTPAIAADLPAPPSSPSSLPARVKHVIGRCTFSHPSGIRSCDCNEGTWVTNADLPAKGCSICDMCGHLISLHRGYIPNSPAKRQWPDNISRRENTVAELLDLVLRHRVVQIRGTPMSGKTTLCKLLEEHIESTRLDLMPFHITWRYPTRKELITHPEYDFYNTWMHVLSGFRLPDNFIYRDDVVLIIDEAQLSYTSHDLWVGVIKNYTDTVCPYIVLFSSYGSADSTALRIENSSNITLEQSQRVSLTPHPQIDHNISLCFTLTELRDVCDRIANKGRFQFSQDVVNYVFQLTNGHPGLCLGLLESVVEEKAGQVIHYEDVIDFFSNESTLFRCIEMRVCRSLPTKHILENFPKMADALRRAIINGGELTYRRDDVGLMSAYERGYLQAEMVEDERILYSFPSHLHQRYCASLVLPDSFDGVSFTTVKELCFAAISHFSPLQLQDHVRKAQHLAIKYGHGSQLEAQYADELYRCLYKVTKERCIIHSEFSYTNNGRLDFFLRAKSWGIEVLHEDDQKNLNQFKRKSKYSSWNLVKDSIALNFRRSEPDPKTKCNDLHLFIVIFAPNNDSYCIWDSGHNVVVPHTQLFNRSVVAHDHPVGLFLS